MSSVDATIVFFPRFTTLAGAATFTTAPLDVSRFDGAQFQVWLGDMDGVSPVATLYFEESLDAQTWVLGPQTPEGFVLDEGLAKFFSYGFRLRWFRVRLVLTGSEVIATCWAEGLLRGGGGGAWVPAPVGAPPGMGGELGGMAGATMRLGRNLVADWSGYVPPGLTPPIAPIGTPPRPGVGGLRGL